MNEGNGGELISVQYQHRQRRIHRHPHPHAKRFLVQRRTQLLTVRQLGTVCRRCVCLCLPLTFCSALATAEATTGRRRRPSTVVERFRCTGDHRAAAYDNADEQLRERGVPLGQPPFALFNASLTLLPSRSVTAGLPLLLLLLLLLTRSVPPDGLL